MAMANNQGFQQESEWIENVVRIFRCSTVVKGGRRFSFSALAVVGDGRGTVGIGYGKANEVPSAVEKGMKDARKNLVKVSLVEGTIPHEVVGRFRSARIILVPAGPGTGIIAGSPARAVLAAAGVKNILTKCHCTTNPKNIVKATLDGLMKSRTVEEAERLRGKRLASA